MLRIILFLSILVITSYLLACDKSPYSEQFNPITENTSGKLYVDSQYGDDNNIGSKEFPWKTLYNVNRKIHHPGDTIFLKRGSSWESRLVLKGSGVENKPVVLTSYGKGDLPHIMGNGKVDQVILLEEIDHWVINSVEVSNKANAIGNRTGILIKCLQPGLRKHFHITNCFIHDVMGDYSMETRGKNTGGIGVIGGKNTKFDNILIEGNEIGHINRVGIFTTMMNDRNTLQLNSARGERPITNLIIKGNKIHHCTGDGVIVRGAHRPIISHNIAWENHNGPEDLVKAGVALWCRSTDEALFEYNEVYNTRGSMDGQAFDADLDAYRTVVQYNYSHGNEGGFMLVYGSSSDAIVRYNVSVNDGKNGKHIFDFPVWTSPRGSGIFHNNTIIIPEDVDAVIADEAIESARFYNNVFYNLGKGRLFIESRDRTASFSNNIYYGYNSAEIPDSNQIFGNPMIISPTNVQIGWQYLKNFKLDKNSPYLNMGIDVQQVEGEDYWIEPVDRDIEGRKLLKDEIPMGALLN